METLLLPGMDGTGRLFASLLPHLAPDLRPRVVAYPPDRPRSYDELLDDLPVPAGPFAIVAESFSGPLGIRLASRYPTQVRALVLVATFVRRPSAAVRWMSALGSSLFRPRLPDVALRVGVLGLDASDDDVSALSSALSSVHRSVLAGRLRELVRIDVTREFSAGRAPVLYLAGGRDRLVGAGVMAQLERLRPDMETRVLDAPHLVLQRRPIEAGALISEFIHRNVA